MLSYPLRPNNKIQRELLPFRFLKLVCLWHHFGFEVDFAGPQSR